MNEQSSLQLYMTPPTGMFASGFAQWPYIGLFMLGSLLALLLLKIKHRNSPTDAHRQKPVTAHGRLPFLGHVLSMIAQPESFLRQLLSTLRHAPIQVLLPGSRFYLASPGGQVAWLLRGGREVVPTPSLLSALRTFFGLRDVDLRVFEHSNISLAEARLGFSTSHPDPSRRIMEHQRRDFVLYLQGPGLNTILNRFIRNLKQEMLQRTAINDDWTVIPDLYTFVVTTIFRSEVEAFAEYDPVWGSKYVRTMLGRFLDLGFSEDGVDTAMLGFLFVTFANIIPAVAWMILHLLLDDGIVERVRAELSKTSLDGSGFISMDDLEYQPLLNSIYRETLRLRVASSVGRKPTVKTYAPGGWEFGANIPILFPAWLSGLDDSFWNTGGSLPGGGSQYPVDTFWPERFLQYPNEPLSGPTRKGHPSHQMPAGRVPPRSASDDRGAKLVTKGIQGHWFPFGGGASRCPGEALAKQTILTSVVFVIHNFDVQLCAPEEARKIGSHHRVLPFGSHAFDRPVPIRIRRRLLL
ncbi:hypothetical protein NCS55_01485600 [Fusarium keratoplasticum]|nr:hypothetical protein NCS55_01485600 [Fusarium keratoplasticum]